jgi:flagellar biosynthesis protein FliQ
MDATTIIAVGKEAFVLGVMIAAPVLLASLVVGVLISIFQAATSISDATLNFAPKVLVAGAVLIFTMPWMINKIVSFMTTLFNQIPTVIR